MAVPSLTMRVQVAALTHCTEVTAMAPTGGADGAQLLPPSCVVSTTPVLGSDPFEPTAMHTLAVGHDTPVSAGMVFMVSGCAAQVSPPLAVPAMTVTAELGPVVVVAGALGPATPTAQQWWASAQDTALNSPVPAGAGWPTTTGVPDCSPRTRGATVEGLWVATEQETLVTATITSSTPTRPVPARRAGCESDVGREGTAGGQ